MRRLLLLALPAAALLATACGSSDDTVAATPTTTTPGVVHPTGADDVVVQLDVSGGFVPVEMVFTAVPQVTIYGDGTVLRPGAVAAIFPGPMVMPVFESKLTEEGLQRVLAAADEAGLLKEPPAYDSPASQQMADLPTTTVVLDAGGGRWVHQAYALVDDALDTPARESLSTFVTALSSLETLAGPGNLGPEESYQPTQLRIRATPSPAQPDDIEPTIVAWPDTSVKLADAATCAVVGGATVKTLQDANQLTWFTDGGVTYSLVARPILPGEPPCPE